MEYKIGDENDKQYGLLDKIIMGLCFGEVNPKHGGEIWNKVEDWLY